MCGFIMRLSLSCRGLCSRQVAHPALSLLNGLKSVRLYIEGCRHVIVHPRGLFVHISLFATDRDVSQFFRFFRCCNWMSVETDRRMGDRSDLFITSL